MHQVAQREAGLQVADARGADNEEQGRQDEGNGPALGDDAGDDANLDEADTARKENKSADRKLQDSSVSRCCWRNASSSGSAMEPEIMLTRQLLRATGAEWEWRQLQSSSLQCTDSCCSMMQTSLCHGTFSSIA